MTKVLAWLLGTKIGRTILATLAVCLVVWLSWLGFSAHYYNAGVVSCQLGLATDTNAANVAQGEKNAANNQTSSEVGRDTVDNVNAVINESDTQTSDAKETIRYVYRDAPRTAPVALGSCVHPVDDRVQERIDDAVRRASRAP